MTLTEKPHFLPIDHVTILGRSLEASRAFYDVVLSELGFEKRSKDVWRSPTGLHVQLRAAKHETTDYERYGPGVNHIGFSAPDADFVTQLATRMNAAGHVARLQHFPDGTVAVFLPDPDGMRLEVAWYPPGVPPVD